MVNIGITGVKNKTAENFTTKTGAKIRRIINKPLRLVLNIAAEAKIILEEYPKLEPNQNYIFVSTHYHSEDILSNLATIDRNAYALMGTTDQIEHNPQMYAAWLNGMIYVDRLDPVSRKEALKKMAKTLEYGSSVLIFAEGGYNNTENLLCQRLFASPYYLAKITGKQVVPISNFYEPTTNTIYIKAGAPLDLTVYQKEEALDILRDEMATMMFEQIEQHSIPLKRAELAPDFREKFMEERKNEYLRVKWTRDVWDEELTTYKDKSITTPEEVRASLDDVEITRDNAYIMAPIRVRRKEDHKYNFKKYMKENWDK